MVGWPEGRPAGCESPGQLFRAAGRSAVRLAAIRPIAARCRRAG
jgi:hypothetical protein